MNYSLLVDVETTGLVDSSISFRNYIEGPQIIQLGALVVDKDNNYKIIEKFKTNISFVGKHNGVSYGPYDLTWSKKSEKIHGITILETTKFPTPYSAMSEFSKFLKKYFENKYIPLIGYNIQTDIYFIRQLIFLSCSKFDINFDYKMLDIYSLTSILYNIETSQELFKKVLGIERKTHDALEDCNLTQKVLEIISKEINFLKTK